MNLIDKYITEGGNTSAQKPRRYRSEIRSTLRICWERKQAAADEAMTGPAWNMAPRSRILCKMLSDHCVYPISAGDKDRAGGIGRRPGWESAVESESG
jgi:hypothetical protein